MMNNLKEAFREGYLAGKNSILKEAEFNRDINVNTWNQRVDNLSESKIFVEMGTVYIDAANLEELCEEEYIDLGGEENEDLYKDVHGNFWSFQDCGDYYGGYHADVVELHNMLRTYKISVKRASSDHHDETSCILHGKMKNLEAFVKKCFTIGFDPFAFAVEGIDWYWM